MDETAAAAFSQEQKWREEAFLGGEIENIVASEAWKKFEVLVLDEAEKEIFNTLRNPSFDITDTNQLYQYRALLQTIPLLRKKMQRKIEAGKIARRSLSEMSTEMESEHA